MAKQAKRLLIVSVDKSVNNFLRTIVHNIIGGEVRVYGQSIEEGLERPLKVDVVMTSGPFLLPRVKEIYPDKTVVAPKRLITGHNLEKLLMLPRSTPVLVVNHPRSATEETIESLKNLGITHLKYVPYWKGSKTDSAAIRTAISPGMAHLCPREFERVIDIGPRIISMHSFLELLVALELDLSYIENFATYYHNFLMESSRKLASVLEQSELLRKYQEVILNQFEDGLLSVNESGRIDLANKAAGRLLNRDLPALLSSTIHDVLGAFRHKATLPGDPSGDGRSASIYDHDRRQVLIQKIPVEHENRVGHVYTFREIARIQSLEKDVRVRLAEKGHITKYGFDDIWTRSKAVQAVKDKARTFARTEKNLLITGESGTGKELFAHAIHQNSLRCDGPFVAVNFAGIPETLIESELFGYEPGAFTGARKGGKTGLFEDAHRGTIFLDEIGDAPLAVQSRLLRVIQEREIMRVGGSRILPVDVRILAGTNRDLRQAMEENRFRKDLYYRLNTLPLELPPLREHPEDILYILERYLDEVLGIRKPLSRAAEACLLGHAWPGNIRELINFAEFVAISSQGSDTIAWEHLPKTIAGPACEAHSGDPGERGEGWEGILQQLRREGAFFDSMVCILTILRERNPVVTGRTQILKGLSARRHHVTEGRLKRLLRTLRQLDLIHVGTTKQGTLLTRKGEALLDHLHATGRASGPEGLG